MEYHVQLPLFSHIALIPVRSEIRSEQLEWLNVREGRTLRLLPSCKRDEDQEPAKVKLIALILCFTTV